MLLTSHVFDFVKFPDCLVLNKVYCVAVSYCCNPERKKKQSTFKEERDDWFFSPIKLEHMLHECAALFDRWYDFITEPVRKKVCTVKCISPVWTIE